MRPEKLTKSEGLGSVCVGGTGKGQGASLRTDLGQTPEGLSSSTRNVASFNLKMITLSPLLQLTVRKGPSQDLNPAGSGATSKAHLDPCQ